MIVAMQEGATEDQIQQVIDHLVKMGVEVPRSTGARQTVLGAVAARTEIDIRTNSPGDPFGPRVRSSVCVME